MHAHLFHNRLRYISRGRVTRINNRPTAQPGSPIITGLPTARGISYHAAQGWVALSRSVLMPFEQQKPTALEILNVGSDHAIVEMPGPRAGVQIGSDVPICVASLRTSCTWCALS